jgi:hypothetical protein
VFSTRTRLLAILVTGVALFDYLEDGQIFWALAGQNPPIFVPSLIKWGLLGVVFLVLSRILLISKSAVYTLPTKRLMSITYFAAGVLILADVTFGQWIGYSHIALGAAIFSALLIINAVGLVGHYVAIPGIKLTYIENFCEQRTSATAIRSERARPTGPAGDN